MGFKDFNGTQEYIISGQYGSDEEHLLSLIIKKLALINPDPYQHEICLCEDEFSGKSLATSGENLYELVMLIKDRAASSESKNRILTALRYSEEEGMLFVSVNPELVERSLSVSISPLTLIHT